MVNPDLANPFAYFMLLGWAPFTLFLFATRSPARAASISALGGAMLLPELLSMDPPLLPPFDKLSIPCLAIFIGLSIWGRGVSSRAKAFSGLERIALALIVAFSITILNNGDPIPGNSAMTSYDLLAATVRQLLVVWVPFRVGRIIFRNRREVLALLVAMAAGATLYSLLGLIELRLAPTLHDRMYGFAQHDFMQQIRGDGFRPMVFMTHGLNLSRYMMICLLCAVALARLNKPVMGIAGKVVAIYLAVVLVLFKSTGAIFWAMVFGPVIYLATPKTQLRLAMALASLVYVYPALRIADVVPTADLVQLAETHTNKQRARSLKDRFDQEGPLLEKALKRPYFGWGANGRNNVYYSNGDQIATDGEWVILVGERGIIGFLLAFSVLLVPVFSAFRALKHLSSQTDARMLGGLALCVAICAADNILNSSGSVPQFFFAGSLAGAAEGLVSETRRRRARQLRETASVATPARPTRPALPATTSAT